MSLNETVSAERVHIGFFGMRNAGKSSVVNAVTGQELSVVSDIKGTTTDPVKKAMELLPIGPVVIIDTPGLDDEGYLGEKRVEKSKEILGKTDIAVLVVDASRGISDSDRELLEEFKKRGLPFIVAFNKADLLRELPEQNENEIYVSAKMLLNINELKEKIGALSKKTEAPRFIIGDLVENDDIVILVTPIDESAPKGRLILPQQLTLRELLDFRCSVIVCQDSQLASALSSLKKPPKMVITDSQAFRGVAETVPESIPLTSFSILMARYKGELEALVDGASRLADLKDGDKILISEGCTHHRQCNDIGTVKLPAMIKSFSACEPEFSFTSGGEFPKELSGYSLVVHCGGCMLNEKEMKNRIRLCKEAGIPVVNYGVAIAHMTSILKRSLEIFPDLYKTL